MTEEYEQLQSAIQGIYDVITKSIEPICGAFQRLFDNLEPYQKFEILHPRKKPRGSIRRSKK